MDSEKIAAIEVRLKKISEGPWRAMLEGRDHSSGSSCIITGAGGIDFDGASDADIDFIAAAPQDIAYLISEIRRIANIGK